MAARLTLPILAAVTLAALPVLTSAAVAAEAGRPGDASRGAQPACRTEAVGAGRSASSQDSARQAGASIVRAIPDGRTLVLEDGREVLLHGIEIPDRDDAKRIEAPDAALAALVGSAPVTLHRAGPSPDRYGRVVAYVFTGSGTEARLLQAELVGQGHAVAAARIADASCASELLRQERRARDAKLGVWAEPYYVLGRADDPSAVLADRGRFAVVEGKVLSVRESGGTIYVNFGRRWTEDFTVTIAKRNERVFAGSGLQPKSLEGRRVRIRGIVEERGGPWIEALRPEQIELADRN